MNLKSQLYFDEEDSMVVGTFAILWAAFEEKYYSRDCKMCRINKSHISYYNHEAVALAEQLRYSLMNFVNNDIDHAVSSLRLDEKYEFDVRSFIEAPDMIDDEKKIKAALMICCRIRNNMFHGEKAIPLLNVQRPLFESCIAFLDELIVSKAIIKYK